MQVLLSTSRRRKRRRSTKQATTPGLVPFERVLPPYRPVCVVGDQQPPKKGLSLASSASHRRREEEAIPGKAIMSTLALPPFLTNPRQDAIDLYKAFKGNNPIVLYFCPQFDFLMPAIVSFHPRHLFGSSCSISVEFLL